MTKIEVKLRNKEILNFTNVKEILIDNGFLIIGHLIGKNKLKLEPIALENIDYWIEEGKLK